MALTCFCQNMYFNFSPFIEESFMYRIWISLAIRPQIASAKIRSFDDVHVSCFKCFGSSVLYYICIYIIISFYPLFSTPSIFANNPPLHPSRMSYDFPATFSVFPASWVELVQWAAWSHAALHCDLWSVPVRQRRDYGYLSGEKVSQHQHHLIPTVLTTILP